MKLEKPTRELVDKYRRASERRNNGEEEAIRELFKIFLDNKDCKGVLLKSILINELYSTQIIGIKNVAKHIFELDIDERNYRFLPPASRACEDIFSSRYPGLTPGAKLCRRFAAP
jgi:hypothetical protein